MYMIFFCVATGIQRIVGPGPGICNGWSMWNDFVQVCYGNALRLYKLRPLWEFSCLEVLTDGFLPTYLLDMKKEWPCIAHRDVQRMLLDGRNKVRTNTSQASFLSA